MAMKARYTVVDGEVIAETRGGVRKLYVPDPLGSTVALVDNTQTQTDTFSYWPYGEVNNRTGTTATPFQFVGTAGVYTDAGSLLYLGRPMTTSAGRFMTQPRVDPEWFDSADLGYTALDIITLGTEVVALQQQRQAQVPPKPDLLEFNYGFYCGAQRTPYPDNYGFPRDHNIRRRQKPPHTGHLDGMDKCCQRHDFVYWCNDCKNVDKPDQTPDCHSADVVLCNCWKKTDCARDYPTDTKRRTECLKFKRGRAVDLCDLVRLHGTAQGGEDRIKEMLPRVR